MRKKEKLSELYGPGGNFTYGKDLGYAGADSGYSSYLSHKKFPVDYFDTEEEEEEIVDGDILRKRERGISGYELEKTLAAVNEEYEYLDSAANVLKYGGRALKSGTKAALLSVPVLDAIAGSIYLTSGILRFRKVSNDVIKYLDVPEDSFAQALGANSEAEWDMIIQRVSMTNLSDRAQLEIGFNDLLFNIKSFIVTLFQAYDSLIAAPAAAAAGGVSLGAGTVAVEGGVNIVSSFGGFLAEMVPAERLIFELITKYHAVVEQLFSLVMSGDVEDVEELEKKGGPVFMSLIMNPSRSMRRLGQFYEAVSSEEAPTAQVMKGIAGKVMNEPETLPYDQFMDQVSRSYDKTIDESLETQCLRIFLREDIGTFGSSTDSKIDVDDEDDTDNSDIDEVWTTGPVTSADDDDDSEIDEQAMAGGVPGVAVPMGQKSTGGYETEGERRKRWKKADIYRVAENQNWAHKTAGKIKFK